MCIRSAPIFPALAPGSPLSRLLRPAGLLIPLLFEHFHPLWYEEMLWAPVRYFRPQPWNEPFLQGALSPSIVDQGLGARCSFEVFKA